jgi:putative restriction endonuclease
MVATAMADPISTVQDEEFRRQLLWLRTNYGTVVDSQRLGRLVRGFKSQKGIYKPSGSAHALWVRQTLRGVYPDERPQYFPDGSWTYRYSPEGRGGRIDMTLDTNRALLRGMADQIPVGVLREISSKSGSRMYEVLGLAYVERFDGTHFVLHGESIAWETPPPPEASAVPFHPFEEGPARLASSVRHLRDQRFAIAVRQAYHEKCSLCEVGYRVRGRVLGLEAAHIIPVSDRGTSADIRNGMLLCNNHHVLFDEFAWTPDEDLRVLVVDDEDFRRSAAANCVLDWEGKRLPNLPETSQLHPAGEALRYRLERFDPMT